MNSNFRRYGNIGGNPAHPPKAAPTPEAAPKKPEAFASEKSQFAEISSAIGYAYTGSGASVAIFDYGYFGTDVTENVQRGGGTSSGGGSKLINDSRVAPSPFSNIFGGSGR